MAPKSCALCQNAKAILRRCFFRVFETEVHNTITEAQLFKPGDRVPSERLEGKVYSTVLAYVMKTLNERYRYGLSLFLLSIDEGITGYRDDSLETVKRNQQQYDMPLKILSYDELYGWTMDRVVSTIGKKNNCTFCGVFRRQAWTAAPPLSAHARDIARLGRCTAICTQGEDTIRRSKPFKYAYEKEIVIYFSTECIYSPDAYRSEAARPSAIIDIIHSGEAFEVKEEVRATQKAQQTCKRCGYMSSNDLCKACSLLEGLERGMSTAAISDKGRRKLEAEGPTPDNLRTIPYFRPPTTVTIDVPAPQMRTRERESVWM
ncbi:hypothetical protein BJV77DRAFT_1116749 [Russula vinacea]|nr:hypothetical protein BJV77DRAFT_1116749 [Russula vinacea]